MLDGSSCSSSNSRRFGEVILLIVVEVIIERVVVFTVVIIVGLLTSALGITFVSRGLSQTAMFKVVHALKERHCQGSCDLGTVTACPNIAQIKLIQF